MISSSPDCARTRVAGRARALSRSGLRWWEDVYYVRPGEPGRNFRSSDLLVAEANKRRITALLKEMRTGVDPKLCTLLLFFVCALALAKARELVTAPATDGISEIRGLERSQSLVVDANEPEMELDAPDWTLDQSSQLGSASPQLRDLGEIGGVPTGAVTEENNRTLNRQWSERRLSDIPESAPHVRLNDTSDYDRLVSASLLNRPVDGMSPHWWQNLRQDGVRGFGGAAERHQSTFSHGDWHGGAGRRGAYAHASSHGGSGAPIDPDVAVGPLELDFNGFISSEYTDNRELTAEDKASGFLMAGGINAKATVDITENNKLHINVGVGVDQFFGDEVEDDGLQVHVTPDTFADLNLRFGDLEVRLYDRFTLRRNRRFSSFSPDAIDTGDFWSNAAGISAFYPINDSLTVHGILDYSIDEALEEEFDAINNDTLTGSVGLTLSPNGEYTVGLQGTTSQRDYDVSFNNDADVSSVGLFAHSPISDFTRLEANGGFQSFDFSTGGASGDTDQLEDYFLSLGIRNELNDMVTHSLLGGHGADYGALSNFESYEFVRYELKAEPTAATTFDLVLGYRWNDESGDRDAQDETLNVVLHGSQRLTDHFAIGVRGAFSSNQANLEGRDYDEYRAQAYARWDVNEATSLNLSYQRWDVTGTEQGFVENSIGAGMSVDF